MNNEHDELAGTIEAPPNGKLGGSSNDGQDDLEAGKGFEEEFGGDVCGGKDGCRGSSSGIIGTVLSAAASLVVSMWVIFRLYMVVCTTTLGVSYL